MREHLNRSHQEEGRPGEGRFEPRGQITRQIIRSNSGIKESDMFHVTQSLHQNPFRVTVPTTRRPPVMQGHSNATGAKVYKEHQL